MAVTGGDAGKRFMELALDEAARAASLGEVPVGAVLVDNNQRILACAGNRSIEHSDPSAHAEIIALRQAGAALHNYRLVGTTLYVTLEPCLMCMGAMVHARIERLVFAAADPKTGAAISRYQVGQDGKLNHEMIVEHGMCAAESTAMLQKFFRDKRKSSYGP